MAEQKPKDNQKTIITIAGQPGSGKSTTAKEVAARLGFAHFSSGDYFRQLGSEKGVELLRANRSPKESDVLDRMVDEKLKQIGLADNRMVIDSRLAWHWIPRSFKVFLRLDLATAATRILSEATHNRQASEDLHEEPAKYTKILQQRLKSEIERYETKYGVNPNDPDNYDLIIDTSTNSLAEAVELIVNAYSSWQKR